jgi:hypothetical protein
MWEGMMGSVFPPNWLSVLVGVVASVVLGNSAAQASPITFSGTFNAETDKVWFHGKTTDLPIDYLLKQINVDSTGGVLGGLATSISYWEPTGGVRRFVGTELGNPDAHASRTIAGTDYFFALMMRGNEPIGDFGRHSPSTALQAPPTVRQASGSFAYLVTHSVRARAIGPSHLRVSIPSNRCPSQPQPRSHSSPPG